MNRLETWTEPNGCQLRKDAPGDIMGDWVYADEAREQIARLEAHLGQAREAVRNLQGQVKRLNAFYEAHVGEPTMKEVDAENARLRAQVAELEKELADNEYEPPEAVWPEPAPVVPGVIPTIALITDPQPLENMVNDMRMNYLKEAQAAFYKDPADLTESEKFSLAMAAGCQIDSVILPQKGQFRLFTKNPVGFQSRGPGCPIQVVEQRG